MKRAIIGNLPKPIAFDTAGENAGDRRSHGVTKLAAIALPQNQDLATQQSIRRAIDDSFVSGFRVGLLIGAILAAASALTALALIANPDQS